MEHLNKSVTDSLSTKDSQNHNPFCEKRLNKLKTTTDYILLHFNEISNNRLRLQFTSRGPFHKSRVQWLCLEGQLLKAHLKRMPQNKRSKIEDLFQSTAVTSIQRHSRPPATPPQ